LAAGIAVLGAPTLAASAATHPSSKPAVATPAGLKKPPRLKGPKTSSPQNTQYLADVAKADPPLATYIQQRGNVALRALLTDGTAFCAFLHRGGGLDSAIVSVAIGARSVESQTHLPSNVSTFNTMEAVALVVLCPSDQKLVPASVRSKIRSLTRELAK
jgi:hypothetical protein